MTKAVRAKICGLSTPETLAAVLDAGAAYVGAVVFAPSPRHLEPEAAGPLFAAARGRAAVVAVTVNADDALIARIAAHLRPDLIQLHGAETPERAAEVRRMTGAGIIRALPVSTAEDLDAAAAWEAAADHLLFDARPPKGSTLPGGVGARFDWELLAGRRFARPWFLAGGLDAANVGEALAITGAPRVDVSSGVESAPGVKDAGRIAAFMTAVRGL